MSPTSYDPKIQNASDFDSNIVDSNLGLSGGYVYGVYLHESSFSNLNRLEIGGSVFNKNLVNNCVYSSLYVYILAQANTFIDNYGEEVMDELYVFVPEYSFASGYESYSSSLSLSELTDNVRGMRYCSVTGYMCVYNIDKFYKDEYEVEDIYYVFDKDNGIYCGDNSIKSNEVSKLEEWEFSFDSPVFVTDYFYDYLSDDYFFDYEITYNLSTEISSDSSPYILSDTCFMYLNAVCNIGSDKKSVIVNVSSMLEDYYDYNYDTFSLGGIYTKANTYSDFSSTALKGQDAYVSGMYDGYGIYFKEFNLSTVENGVKLTWSDDRLSDGDLSIYKSIDNKDYEYLTTVDFSLGQFVDSEVLSGHKYTYKIVMGNYYYPAAIIYEGSGKTDFDINVIDNSISVSLKSAINTNKITYTLPSIMVGSIEFSDNVKLISTDENFFGITKNAKDNTTTIFIGNPNRTEYDYFNIGAGELFRVKPENGLIPVITGFSLNGKMLYYNGFGNTTAQTKNNNCSSYSILLIDPDGYKPAYKVYSIK